jgi:hypothetical protein
VARLDGDGACTVVDCAAVPLSPLRVRAGQPASSSGCASSPAARHCELTHAALRRQGDSTCTFELTWTGRRASHVNTLSSPTLSR